MSGSSKGQGTSQTRLYELMADGRRLTSASVAGALGVTRVAATSLLVGEHGAGNLRRIAVGVYVKSDGRSVREDDPDSFQVLIPKLMKEKGLSYRDLAAMSGINHPHLYNVTSGKRGMSQEYMESVAAALGIKPEAISDYRLVQIVERLRADPKLERRVYRLAV